MYNIVPIWAFVLFISTGVLSQKCNDCINYDRCPAALDLALHKRTVETMQLFREAACGFDTNGKVPVAKVCCSMFLTTKSGAELDSPEDIRINNHKNLELLPRDCGYIKGDRIIGGKVADLYEFPWMALISHQTRYGINFQCGGSIINKRYVLTAAHCVKDKNIAGIRLGEYDIFKEIDCQKGVCEKHIQDVPIEKTVLHDKYEPLPSLVNDIALIRLAQDVDFNHRNVRSICLPTKSEFRHRSLNDVIATVTGWGLTENNTDSSVLRKVDIPIHTAQNCSGLYNRLSRPGDPDVTSDQLCAGSLNKDSCNGDSGGPLILEEKYDNGDRYVQYGIVSHGPRLCGSEYPGVYTDVRKYMGWILDNIY